MTPSVWSVLVIFVLAPLGVAVLVTALVLMLTSSTRRTVVEASDGSPDEGSVDPDEEDADTRNEGKPPP